MINNLPQSLIDTANKILTESSTDRSFTKDQHGKNIVYDDGEYSISVNNPNNAEYIALWHSGKKVGNMYLGHGRTSDTKGYATVRSIDIDKKHRGQHMGKKMYEVALEYVHEKYKGIGSEQPDRVNKKQVPAIFRRLGGTFHQSGDITVDKKPPTIDSVLDDSIDIRKIPAVDISHHHPRNHLFESRLIDWINKGQPEEHEFPSFTMDSSLSMIIGEKAYGTPDQFENLAMQHVGNLEEKHYTAVDAYIMGGLEDGHETGSKFVNEHLIKRHAANKEPNKEFSFGDDDFKKVLNIDHLDSALERNTLEKQLVTYSGLGFNPKDIMKDNGLLHLPAYTSSSTNRAVSLLYAKKDNNNIRHVMQIKHPKGSTGLYIGDNDDLSPFMQKEHIMPRNTTVKVSPEPEEHMDNMGNKLYVWKATRLTRKPKQ